MHILTKIKHWQLFLSLFFVGLLPSLVVFEYGFEVQMTLFIALYFLWMLSICKLSMACSGEPKKGSIWFFYGCMFYVFGYSSFFLFVALRNPEIPQSLIIGPHLFGMACVFFCIGYTAWYLAKAARNGGVLSYFLSLWFVFIGVWYVQPKVNRLAKESNA